MKKIISVFSVVVFVLLAFVACNPDTQEIRQQENTASIVSAWQDCNGKIYVDINNSATGSSAPVYTSYAPAGSSPTEWLYWMRGEQSVPYSNIESFVGQNIGLYTKLGKYNNDDGSIVYEESAASEAFFYKVKGIYDTFSESYRSLMWFARTFYSDGTTIRNLPSTGTYDDSVINGWSYTIGDDTTVRYCSYVYYLNTTGDRVILKKLTISGTSYTLSNPETVYEYAIVDSEDQTGCALPTDNWCVYNSVGIPVTASSIIKLRIKETADMCCSDITILSAVL